ncbi:1-phosphofructokinase family hexose kinase [Paenibacillus shenyangensis]|uniref:1-phosphofructokinase family hexose kinase n=1 Tax=Paenibacillus sp. A9 TaxID=1284352 RepID=UPI0003643188|nr:1-phosphofructokinase family hexose kinase [Paenibacillus sp. A9]
MITTVTLNAALDIIYQIPSLQMNHVHRVPGLTLPGGKGVNAARVIRQLGEPVTAAGFTAGYNGQKMQHLLARAQVDCQFTEADGETRLAITILEQQQQTQTELIEPGPLVTSVQIEQLSRTLETLASQSDWVLFSGSLPQGCPEDLYARLIGIARDSGARTALDSSGAALHHGIAAAPDLIKPNAQEACDWAGIVTGGLPPSPEQLRQALTAMLDQGSSMATISLGADGAVAAERESGRFYRIRVPELQIISALGSGDAMAAGMVTAASRGGSFVDMLRLGSSCGSACALQPAAGMIDLDDVQHIGTRIQITPEA